VPSSSSLEAALHQPHLVHERLTEKNLEKSFCLSTAMPKRNKDVEELVTSNKALVDGLLQLNRDELAAVLAHISNEACIRTVTFIKARKLPSFSTVKWSELAPQLGLPKAVSLYVQLKKFKTPTFAA